ncbi:MAG: caspase, EACC1-associated type, partial [Stackebrandtia sp.]
MLVGAGQFDKEVSKLDSLPAVNNNLEDLAGLLKTAWNLPPQHIDIVRNPTVPRDLSRAVQRAADDATDTLLIYYAGHGLIDPHQGDDLHLAVYSTEKSSVHDTAVPYKWIKRAVENTVADRRIVILDCCYSARAFGILSDNTLPEVALISQGTYLLAAAAETAVALSPPGERHTA